MHSPWSREEHLDARHSSLLEDDPGGWPCGELELGVGHPITGVSLENEDVTQLTPNRRWSLQRQDQCRA